MRKKLCKNCTYYSDYYKQLASGYARLNHGFCSKHLKAQTQHEVCEEFKSNAQKEKRREKLLFITLEQTLKSINEIAQILREKIND